MKLVRGAQPQAAPHQNQIGWLHIYLYLFMFNKFIAFPPDYKLVDVEFSEI